jgi:hypothetical protein
VSFQQRIANIKLSDRVAYSAAYCRQIGAQTGETAFMREKFRRSSEPMAFCRVRW